MQEEFENISIDRHQILRDTIPYSYHPQSLNEYLQLPINTLGSCNPGQEIISQSQEGGDLSAQRKTDNQLCRTGMFNLVSG